MTLPFANLGRFVASCSGCSMDSSVLSCPQDPVRARQKASIKQEQTVETGGVRGQRTGWVSAWGKTRKTCEYNCQFMRIPTHIIIYNYKYICKYVSLLTCVFVCVYVHAHVVAYVLKYVSHQHEKTCQLDMAINQNWNAKQWALQLL